MTPEDWTGLTDAERAEKLEKLERSIRSWAAAVQDFHSVMSDDLIAATAALASYRASLEAAPVLDAEAGEELPAGFTLKRTCFACPEQYDVLKDGAKVGYLRLRHGEFRADYPDCGGETVFEGSPLGDGLFDESERAFWLASAVRAIRDRLHKEPR